MNLSRNNWFGMYYNWIYRTYPNDLCSFFWGTLLILLLFPIIVPGRIFARSFMDQEISTYILYSIIFWFVDIIFTVLGVSLIHELGYSYTSMLWLLVSAPILGLIIIGLAGGVVVGTVAGGIYTVQLAGKTDVYTTTKEKARDFVGAIRGKYCTKITWK